jgi:hypothetical protein
MPAVFLPDDNKVLADLRALIQAEATQCDDTGELATAMLESRRLELDGDAQPLLPGQLADSFLQSLGPPYAQYVQSQHPHHWVEQTLPQATMLLTNLLTEGLAAEPPVFYRDRRGAEAFLRSFFGQFDAPSKFLTNWIGPLGAPFAGRGGSGWSVFQTGSALEAGLIALSPKRVGMVWFIGYD